MEQKKFETHIFGGKQLPFIFHRDIHKEDLKSEIDMNWHPNIELLYFIQGEGTVFCGNQTYLTAPGDLIVINSNLPHTIASAKTVCYHCLIVDEEFCLSNDIETECVSFEALIQDETAEELYQQVIQAFHSTGRYRSAGIRSAVLALLVYLARHFSEYIPKTKKKASSKDESVKLAIGYVKSHINEKLTIDALADEAGLSKFYFLREFKKITGETPITFINKMRCENAKKMLKTGKHTIKDVCEKNGFENVSYFSKNFKRYTGFTPSEYVQKKNAEKG